MAIDVNAIGTLQAVSKKEANMAEWKEDKPIKREEEEIVTFGWDEADVLL